MDKLFTLLILSANILALVYLAFYIKFKKYRKKYFYYPFYITFTIVAILGLVSFLKGNLSFFVIRGFIFILILLISLLSIPVMNYFLYKEFPFLRKNNLLSKYGGSNSKKILLWIIYVLVIFVLLKFVSIQAVNNLQQEFYNTKKILNSNLNLVKLSGNRLSNFSGINLHKKKNYETGSLKISNEDINEIINKLEKLKADSLYKINDWLGIVYSYSLIFQKLNDNDLKKSILSIDQVGLLNNKELFIKGFMTWNFNYVLIMSKYLDKGIPSIYFNSKKLNYIKHMYEDIIKKQGGQNIKSKTFINKGLTLFVFTYTKSILGEKVYIYRILVVNNRGDYVLILVSGDDRITVKKDGQFILNNLELLK